MRRLCILADYPKLLGNGSTTIPWKSHACPACGNACSLAKLIDPLRDVAKTLTQLEKERSTPTGDSITFITPRWSSESSRTAFTTQTDIVTATTSSRPSHSSNGRPNSHRSRVNSVRARSDFLTELKLLKFVFSASGNDLILWITNPTYAFFAAFGMTGSMDDIFNIPMEVASRIRFVAGGTHTFVALVQDQHEVCWSN